MLSLKFELSHKIYLYKFIYLYFYINLYLYIYLYLYEFIKFRQALYGPLGSYKACFAFFAKRFRALYLLSSLVMRFVTGADRIVLWVTLAYARK